VDALPLRQKTNSIKQSYLSRFQLPSSKVGCKPLHTAGMSFNGLQDSSLNQTGSAGVADLNQS
jgi:hypothetical protein